MKKLIITAVMTLLFGLSTVAQVNNVAVFYPIGNAENHIKDIIFEEIHSSMRTYSEIKVIERETVRKKIDEKNILMDINTEDTKICEIGKAVKADYVFVVTVTEVGNNFTISCKAFDVLTVSVSRLSFAQTRNGLADLKNFSQQTIRDLMDSMEIIFRENKNKKIPHESPVTQEERTTDPQKEQREKELADAKAKEEKERVAADTKAQAQREKELADAKAKEEKERKLADQKAKEEKEKELAEAKAQAEKELAEQKEREERERKVNEQKAKEALLKAEEEKRMKQQNAKIFLDNLPNKFEFSDLGGEKIFVVENYDNLWNLSDMPSWCPIEKRDNSLILTCMTNSSDKMREGSFYVQAEEQSKKIQILQKEKTFLTLSDNIVEFHAIGGNKTLTVNTNAPTWQVSNGPTWCSTTKLENVITLSCRTNLNATERSETFEITAGKESQTVLIKQKALTGLEKGNWKQALNKVMHNGGTTYNDGLYRGNKSIKGSRNGLGVYFFITDNESYWGDFLQGQSSGKGIYIIGKEGDHYFSGCRGCKYYVGNWSLDMKNGLGKCYDSTGEMLYFGYFHNEKPAETFPQKHDGANKFECIEYDNGEIYLGETFEGLRHGLGILCFANGDAWYGEWKEGKRDGNGIEYLYSGAIKTGRWNGDTYSE